MAQPRARGAAQQPRGALHRGRFVLAHLVYPGISFAQLWMTRESGAGRGHDRHDHGRHADRLRLAGRVGRRHLSDRLAPRFRRPRQCAGAADAACAPFMIAYRLVPTDSPLFYVGMAVGIFMLMSLYGSATTAIQGAVPVRMRSTVMGFSMLLLNLFFGGARHLCRRLDQRRIDDCRSGLAADPCVAGQRHSRAACWVASSFMVAARVKREGACAMPAMGMKV